MQDKVPYVFSWEGGDVYRRKSKKYYHSGYLNSPLSLPDGTSEGNVTFLYDQKQRSMGLYMSRFLGPSKTHLGCTEWEYESAVSRKGDLSLERRCSLTGDTGIGGLKLIPTYLNDMCGALNGRCEIAVFVGLMTRIRESGH